MSQRGVAQKIRNQWDLPGLIVDLRKEKWHQTEPNRIDRMHWVGSYHTIEDLAKDAYPAKEWDAAAVEGFEYELVDEYLSALSDVLVEATGGELRQEHVYTSIENDEVFIGQYEDIPAEALRAMGFEIGGTQLGIIFPVPKAQTSPHDAKSLLDILVEFSETHPKAVLGMMKLGENDPGWWPEGVTMPVEDWVRMIRMVIKDPRILPKAKYRITRPNFYWEQKAGVWTILAHDPQLNISEPFLREIEG